ncbi:hypothetical protein ACFV4F_00250 [Kitasatospora sp. NPDC059722]|uniref:hypothetical protein n=1 Tax=unclassified Kitasatospora TaxID=2633591 RepID=UPI0036593EA7
MAIVVTFDIPGVTQAQYDGVIKALTGSTTGFNLPSDLPVAGIVSHVAGPTATGWHVTDVWESREAFDRFAEVLRPILQDVGIPADPPQVFEAYRVVR